MSGMGDGYVGTAQDAVRIRRLEKQREAERRKIQELKTKSASDKGQPGLLQFGSSTSEILETAFKKETVGLVTREQYVEKRVNIQIKIEEEEKEKLQKLRQEEEELQLAKRKKRKIKGNSRLSFADDIDNGSEDEDAERKTSESKRCGKFGKDPTVETSFLPDSEREAEEQAERERLRKQWLREQEQIRNEPLEITYSYWDGAGHRRVIQVRKGDSIGEFLRAVQQQLAPEFREIRTTSVENLLYVKEDLIIPHQHSFYELIVNKARGKSGPLFHFDVHEDVRTIADATIEKDEVLFLRITIVPIVLMQVKLLRGTGTRRINTFSLLQDGRYMTHQRSGSVTPSMEIELVARCIHVCSVICLMRVGSQFHLMHGHEIFL
ncbi:protein XAP5 CIRCADIAN TIMEKEEPER isoform X1 [Ricinus communis]|uniref:protein XAP5 CIRCADIAN TIMEKEEPER isoform X1 n=1 Tax=Ricinus communis TaxID=3988 RepID=UPI00201AB60A|nr:protein XAP5 CIRCADIAN TIMEKEEPER isoform X1 [Ricinus communis]